MGGAPERWPRGELRGRFALASLRLLWFGILDALVHTKAILEHVVDEVFARRASLVVTDVPGPCEPRFIVGKQLKDMMFRVPHPANLGLGLSVLSYAGKVIVGVRIHEGVSKNPGRLVELFEEEASGMLEGA